MSRQAFASLLFFISDHPSVIFLTRFGLPCRISRRQASRPPQAASAVLQRKARTFAHPRNSAVGTLSSRACSAIVEFSTRLRPYNIHFRSAKPVYKLSLFEYAGAENYRLQCLPMSDHVVFIIIQSRCLHFPQHTSGLGTGFFLIRPNSRAYSIGDRQEPKLFIVADTYFGQKIYWLSRAAD